MFTTQSLNKFERLLLMPNIERTRWFIEQQDRSLGRKGTSDHEPLPLSPAQRGSGRAGGEGPPRSELCAT